MRRALASLASVICLVTFPVSAQEFWYGAADVRDVQGEHNSSAAATLGDAPFWEAVEPLLGKDGVCQIPGQAPIRRMPLDEGAELPPALAEFEAATAELGVAGFQRSFRWFTEKGLYPFDALVLESSDPRAPGAVPIFCSTTPMPENSDMRPLYFDYDLSGGSDVYLYLARNVGGEDTIGYNGQRVLLSTMLRSMELYLFDQQIGLYEGGARFIFGMDGSEDAFKDFLSDRRWFFAGLSDAIGVQIYEDTLRPTFGDFDENLERLSYLPGEIDKTFTTLREFGDAETTTGGFFYFLLGDYLNKRYDLLPELVRIFFQADNILKALDELIDAHDTEFRHGLEMALASYAGHSVDWATSRFPGNISDDRWFDEAFDGCKEVSVSDAKLYDSVDVELAPYASNCIKLRVSSETQAWRGNGQFRLEMTGRPLDDMRIDDVYMSLGKTLNTGSNSCYSFINGSPGAIADCLMVPEQGATPQGVLQRYLTSLEVEELDRGGFHEHIFTVTYAPSDHQLGDGSDREPARVTVGFAVDLVQTEGTELLDMATAAVIYASKSDFGPVKAAPTKQAGSLNDDALDGSAIAIDPEMFQSIMPFADNTIALTDETGTSVGVQLYDPSLLTSKATGTFDVIPVFQQDGIIAQPDAKNPSKITIIEHTEDTLHFEIEANLCMADISQLPAMVQADVPDFCEMGREETITTTAAVGFPDTFRSEGQLDPAPTQNYEDLRALRLARLKGQVTTMGGRSPFAAALGGQNPAAPSTPSAPVTQAGEAPDLQCRMLDQAGACDCSCGAKVCMEERRLAGSLLPSQRACRLTCGKAWQSCSP